GRIRGRSRATVTRGARPSAPAWRRACPPLVAAYATCNDLRRWGERLMTSSAGFRTVRSEPSRRECPDERTTHGQGNEGDGPGDDGLRGGRGPLDGARRLHGELRDDPPNPRSRADARGPPRRAVPLPALGGHLEGSD